MASLLSTTWRFDVSHAQQAIWTFAPDGKAMAGGRCVGRWIEDERGHFLIQMHANNPGLFKTVWAGQHDQQQGSGIASPIFNGVAFSFTMQRIAEGVRPQLQPQLRMAPRAAGAAGPGLSDPRRASG